jgi:hypothetical protein
MRGRASTSQTRMPINSKRLPLLVELIENLYVSSIITAIGICRKKQGD